MGVKANAIVYFSSVVIDHCEEEDCKWQLRETCEAMCKTEPFREDPPPVCLHHEERPLAMMDLNVAKAYDFDFKYGKKSALDFCEDLAAIDQSMMQGPKTVVRRRRIIKRRKYPRFGFVPSLEDIKENELFQATENIVDEKKDLAAIHRERALSCGMSVKEEGRRHRHRRSSRK